MKCAVVVVVVLATAVAAVPFPRRKNSVTATMLSCCHWKGGGVDLLPAEVPPPPRADKEDPAVKTLLDSGKCDDCLQRS